MLPRQVGATVAGSLLVAAVAGCSAGSGGPDAAGSELAGASMTPSVAATASGGPGPGSASPSADPTSTLTPEEQKAFEEATEVVLAYRQTITDLYSGARTDLNDLNDVATGDLLDQGLINISRSLKEGWSVSPKGVRIRLVNSRPVTLGLSSSEPRVRLRICLDASDVIETDPDGNVKQGLREELDYSVVRTRYLPGEGWAVAEVSSSKSDPKDRKC